MTRTTATIIYDNNNDNQQEHNLVPSEWTPAARCLRPDLFPPPTHLTNKEEQIHLASKEIDFKCPWITTHLASKEEQIDFKCPWIARDQMEILDW